MKMLRLLLALFFCALLASFTPERPDESGVFRVGHIASLTGAIAEFGLEAVKGAELAAEEINIRGGVLGRRIEVLTEDTRSFIGGAERAAEKLIGQDKVAVLIGEVASSLSLAVAPIAEREKVPMITFSTNPYVTARRGNTRKYIFRACLIDPFQGKVMAKFAKENLNAQRVAILTDNANDYSVGLAQNFRETFTGMGGQIVEQQAYEAGQVDFKSQLTAIRAKNPEAIYVPGYYTEVSLIAIQARELGITVPLLGGDGWDSPELTKGGAKQALEGSFFTNHFAWDDTAAVSREFVRCYEKKYGGKPGVMAALAYDGMLMIAQAALDERSCEREAIGRGLANIRDLQGVTGRITMGDDHNPKKGMVMMTVENGKFIFRSRSE